jgi:uncharacterized surface protein with fasciclin (FAS1) repeats
VFLTTFAEAFFTKLPFFYKYTKDNTMRKSFTTLQYLTIRGWLAVLLLSGQLLTSCDKYPLDDKEPDWLGASIYDYLRTDGRFRTYLQLVEDFDYVEVLSKTGSNTLFVATDEAFDAFYTNNPWGVKRYEDFTFAQKSLILNFGIINNAYLVNMLANYNNNGLREGAAMRRQTAVSVIDSIPFNSGSQLPTTHFWDFYRNQGIYLLKDNTPLTLMYFTEPHMVQNLISNDDFSIITGLTRKANDAHIFGVKIIERDITCKNGYLNILEKVLIPPVNMAEYISTNANTSVFAKLINRFCAPYFDSENTIRYRQLNPDFSDSIFVKRYFARLGGINRYPSGQAVPTELLLPFDPGWNSYTRIAQGHALQSDMAAMFVPTNEALNTYFNSGAGAVLKDRFKTWDSVPNDILPLFIKRHMRTSFVESVPSRFSVMVDEDNSELPVKVAHITGTYIGSNGVIYETNQVYPPDDYISVYGPVLLSANDVSTEKQTKIWRWGITQNDFRLYLNSLVSRYSFFVPTDEYFKNYIDPISVGKDVIGGLRFWYNSRTNAVNATIHRFNPSEGSFGDSIGLITAEPFLRNRMLDMLNSHVVVGDVESGREYYITKGNVVLKVSGVKESLKVQAGGNISLNETVNATRAYNQSNGITYFIDRPIQAPRKSVYKVLSETPEFSAFFDLMSGFPANSKSVVFVNRTGFFGVDYNVKFFNTFNYTVYVPTNDAITIAINQGIIKPWDTTGAIEGINDMTDENARQAEILRLERFIRYHFQDNSVFVDKIPQDRIYQSATIKLDDKESHFGTFKNKYYKIGISSNGGNLKLVSEQNKTAHVITSKNLYNIMTRDYVFNNRPSAFKNADGTGSGSEYSSSSIITSSTAVIHQIDSILNFE